MVEMAEICSVKKIENSFIVCVKHMMFMYKIADNGAAVYNRDSKRQSFKL
jgi:hypothetical protein